MSLTVSLTPEELRLAATVAISRQVENIQRKRRPAYGEGNAAPWETHVIGAIGEMAVAKALGVWWAGMFDFRGMDVPNVQVRTSRGLGSSRRLLLHREDPDDHAFALVLTDGCGNCEIPGWLLARDGKQGRFWSDPTGTGRPAFFVPQAVLRPFDQLRARLVAA